MSMYFEDADDLDSEFEPNELHGVDDSEGAESFEPEDFAALGIDPESPTRARPGSEAKVLMLSARYAAGLPLWNHRDCYEHGPRENELMGSQQPRR